MKQDFALSEITGFLLIFAMITLTAAVFSAAVLPGILEEQERIQSEEILFDFAALKEGMDSLSVSDEPGLTRRQILSPQIFGDACLSLSYGKPVVSNGITYREFTISYETKGQLLLTLDGCGLKKNTETILPSSYSYVVNPRNTAEQMEHTEPFRIDYIWQGSFVNAGRTYQIFSVRFT